jgi:hypothetical protein
MYLWLCYYKNNARTLFKKQCYICKHQKKRLSQKQIYKTFCSEGLKLKDHLGEEDINGRTILKWNLGEIICKSDELDSILGFYVY